jgi:hypothetical protein
MTPTPERLLRVVVDHPPPEERSYVCILRRMPRMQVYLPDELYQQVKERRLPVSELLQEAVRVEVRRQELLKESDTYLAELVAEVGEPTPRQVARAEAIARRIADHHSRRAG